jgi:predicted transcriptional regulator
MSETTTIQISTAIRNSLDKMKIFHRESYNEVLERLMEDMSELNEDTKKEIEMARLEIKQGKFKTHEQVKQKLGL